MRVAITTTQVPFVYGGAEILVDNLSKAVIANGHECEIIKIPFKWYPPENIMNSLMYSRTLDLNEINSTPIDKMIGLKFPAYYLPHENKSLWILHQHRQAYDLWNTEYNDLVHYPNGRDVRDAIRTADNLMLPMSKSIYTISRNVSKRLKNFNKIFSSPLYHPPQNEERFYNNGQDNYIFFPSRLSEVKRQDLAIKAIKHVKSNTKLIIAGRPDNDTYYLNLQRLVSELHLNNKVKFLGSISSEDMIKYYANALAVIYPPYDEDYGYVTLEAMLSKKAVITCTDSGGPNEFVVHDETGYVVEPNPVEMAKYIDSLASDTKRAAEMGEHGASHYNNMNISWNHVVEELLK